MSNSFGLSQAIPASLNREESLTSIIVSCCRSLSTLQDLIVSLAQQHDAPRFEVILVDNGPTSGIENLVAAHSAHLDIKLVMATLGKGPAYARNVGVRSASGDLLLFLDHDDTVEEHYVRAMTYALRAHRFVCAKIDLDALNPSYMNKWPFAQFQHSGANVLPGIKPVLVASGGTLGVRREVYEKVGPFAEELPYCEDIDFCIRAHRAGEVLSFVPQAVLHYRLRDSVRKTFRQRVNWGRAEVLMFKKYAGTIGWAAPSLKEQILSWRLLVRNLRWARFDWGRMWLATYGGTRIGRLMGSILYLTLFM